MAEPLFIKNATSTYEKIAASTDSVVLAEGQGRRNGLYIYNDSTANLFVNIHDEASTSEFTFKLPPNAVYEMPFNYYTNKIYGVWDSADGHAHVTQILR